ncbi:hypothetical protein, partial [Chromobacterium haemolyticum]|uniref:hypothetical protein n=1 Tax=Chromobacterium haemolyticum TaxID=394935 RepID=UPI001EE660E4
MNAAQFENQPQYLPGQIRRGNSKWVKNRVDNGVHGLSQLVVESKAMALPLARVHARAFCLSLCGN